MTDDGPWNLVAGRAREKQRRVVCGTDRDCLADEFQQAHNVGGMPPGSIVRPSTWNIIKVATIDESERSTGRPSRCPRLWAQPFLYLDP